MKLLMCLCLLCFMNISYADDRAGNGGDGLYLNGNLYSLDLVEAGVEKNPVFNNKLTPKKIITDRLIKKLDPKHISIELISMKLREIAQIDEFFALSILKTIEFYNWRLVDSSLIDIKDEDSSLNFSSAKLVQLAVRKNTSILIDRNLFTKLDAANKAALIFHEAIYAMIEPVYLKDPKTSDYYRDYLGKYTNIKAQSSLRAREMTGYLFTRDLSLLGYDGLDRVAQYDFVLGAGAPVHELSQLTTLAFSQIYFDLNLNSWRNSNNSIPFNASHDVIFKYANDACQVAKTNGLNVTLLHVDRLYTSSLNEFESVNTKNSAYLFEITKMINKTTEIIATDVMVCAHEATQHFENSISYITSVYGLLK